MSEDLVAYRNSNTNTTHVCVGGDPGLDVRPNWERIPLGEVSEVDQLAACQAHERNTAQTASIEGAAAAKGVRRSDVDPLALDSHPRPDERRRLYRQTPDGVLSRPGRYDQQIHKSDPADAGDDQADELAGDDVGEEPAKPTKKAGKKAAGKTE